VLQRKRPVRRSALISPFGVGGIADFRNDEALMCAGIDSWFDEGIPPPDLRVVEERLQARLSCDYFVLPPDFSDSQGGPKRRVPHVRFPRWHYCPRCFRMSEATLFGDQPICTSCSDRIRGRRMIPIRIVAACEGGHVEDFPFRKWIGCTCEGGGELYFKSGRSAASIQGTWIECKQCNRRQSLAMAFQPGVLDGKGAPCSGGQPWLGIEPEEGYCRYPLRTLQRGASNLYFPVVNSSIYIPAASLTDDPKIRHILDDPAKWTYLTSGLVDGEPNSIVIETAAGVMAVDQAQLREAVRNKLAASASREPTPRSEEAFRRQEFEILRKGNPDHRGDLFCEPRAGEEFGELEAFVKSIGLVRKLRETRVLTSFTRINPPGGSIELEQPLARNPRPRWLPAVVVRGEGIFVEFRNDVIAHWAATTETGSRISGLVQRYDAQRVSRHLESRGIDARFLFVHTLAHALIRELTYLCGYGSSALRERIYCNLEDHKQPMLGLLIYTASGDSEGTLGGLVSQAEPGKLEALFSSAYRRSLWCSNDPVCIETPAQGAGNVNLAACHGCALLPETSCEEGNRLLDRALLVGTPDRPELGFLHRYHDRWV